MVTIIVTIKVEDFAKWKRAFDGADEMRKQMGIVIQGVYQSVDDPNTISLVSDYPNIEFVKNMLASPKWEENQKLSGVIGGFNVQYFNKVA